MNFKLRASCSLLACAVIVGVAGCSKAAKVARYTKQADADYSEGKYAAAELEYLNALKYDHANAHSMGRLGAIYLDQGSTNKAYFFLNEARKLDLSDEETHLKLGLCFLVAGEKASAAREAKSILATDPKNRDARVLEIQTADKSDLAQIKGEIGPDNSADSELELAMVARREQDNDGAMALLLKAQAADPKSAEIYNALGELQLAMGQRDKADASFEKATEFSKQKNAAILRYAEFKLETGARADAQAMLRGLVHDSPQYLPAALLLAQETAEDRNFAASEKLLEQILQQDPLYPDGLVLQAEIDIKKGSPEVAVQVLEKAKSTYPTSPRIEYELGKAYLNAGSVEPGVAALERAVNLAPDYPDAVITLADTEIRLGKPDVAVLLAKRLVSQRPGLEKANLVLAAGYAAQNDPDDAETIYEKLAQARPNDPDPHFEAGLAYVRQRRWVEARASFEQALKVSPEFGPAIEQLAILDLQARRYDDAQKRVEAWHERVPKNPSAMIVLGRVHAAQKHWAEAEQVLQQAIALEGDSKRGSFMLAQVYSAQGKQDKAIALLKQMLASDPKNTPTLMLLASIEMNQGDFAGAADLYEHATAVDSHNGLAFNNLAWIYSEKLKKPTEAYQAAQKAITLAPNEPHVEDTVGWIYYQKHDYQKARELLTACAQMLPSDADVQYHLGMASYMTGDEGEAANALAKAATQPAVSDSTDLAKRYLSILKLDPDHASAEDRRALEKAVTDDANDPVARAKLARLLEKAGDIPAALLQANQALALSPRNAALVGLAARLELESGDTQKALSMANDAHKLAPDDPAIAATLGMIAQKAGQFDWAVSLFTDSLTHNPGNASVQYALGMSLYGAGRVAEAVDSLHQAIATGLPSADEKGAQHLLDLVALAANPTDPKAADVKADGTPPAIPELMVVAAVAEKKGEWKDAVQADVEVLHEDPQFGPATRQLVLLSAEHVEVDRETLALAIKAQSFYPDDPAVARASGFVAYRLGDYDKTVSLLEATGGDDDAERLFYLGMANERLNRVSGKAMIKRALAMNLRGDLAAEARDTLNTKATP